MRLLVGMVTTQTHTLRYTDSAIDFFCLFKDSSIQRPYSYANGNLIVRIPPR